MKSRKRLFVFLLVVIVIALLSTSALAVYAWGDIDVYLPAHQGDCRTDPVARSGSDSDHYCVGIDSISDGFTSVGAWAENWIGTNYSNPYWILDEQGWDVPYTTKPSEGTNVYLSLDNPVSTTITPRVTGTWSPY